MSILLIRNVWPTSSMNFNIANDVPRLEQSQYGLNFTYHSTNYGINDFMFKHHSYGFTFEPINPTQYCQNTVLSLSSAKAIGWDNIPIKIIKDGIGFIPWLF